MRNAFIPALFLLLVSCQKKGQMAEGPEVFSEASYQLTITGKWMAPQFTVPPSVHFTSFTGAVHNNKAGIWMENALASAGVEAVAEIGNQTLLFAEVDSLLAKGLAFSRINIPPPPPTGSISRTVTCNSNFSRLSFVSMIAPSPDWFVGVSNLALYRNKSWVTDTTVQLIVYDAGTEDGDVFGYANPATVPQQPIQLLTPARAMVLANGNASLAAIAQVRITKQ